SPCWIRKAGAVEERNTIGLANRASIGAQCAGSQPRKSPSSLLGGGVKPAVAGLAAPSFAGTASAARLSRSLAPPQSITAWTQSEESNSSLPGSKGSTPQVTPASAASWPPAPS